MAFLPYGPGADRPEPMSRVVDDGAVELSDTTVRALPTAKVEGALASPPTVMVVGCGVAGGVVAGGLSATDAASVTLSVAGSPVCTVHTTTREGTVVVKDMALNGIGGSFFDALLDALKPETLLVVDSTTMPPSALEAPSTVSCLVSDRAPEHAITTAAAAASTATLTGSNFLTGAAAAAFSAGHVACIPTAALVVSCPASDQGAAGGAVYDAFVGVVGGGSEEERAAACKATALRRETTLGGMFL